MQTAQESERWRPIHMHGGRAVERAERSWATDARLRLRRLARGGAHQGSTEACPLDAAPAAINFADCGPLWMLVTP
jgi:hypothetical protein